MRVPLNLPPTDPEGDRLPYHQPFQLRKEKTGYKIIILYQPNGVVYPLPKCKAGPRTRPTFSWAMEGAELREEMQSVTPLDLAIALGFVGNEVDDLIMAPEKHVGWFFEEVLPSISEDDSRIDRLLSEFCVLYLSELVDAFLKPPFLQEGEDRHRSDSSLWNIYTWMLIRLSTNPYFARFMNSEDSRAEEVLTVYMSFLMDDCCYVYQGLLLQELEHPDKQIPADNFLIFDFFLTLLEFRWDASFRDKTPESFMLPLLGFLDEWARRARNMSIRMLLSRISSTLKAWPSYIDAADNERLTLLVRKQECAQPGCGERGDLYSCGHCGTALYCGRAHQRSHYDVHRHLCFDIANRPSVHSTAQ